MPGKLLVPGASTAGLVKAEDEAVKVIRSEEEAVEIVHS